jgi:hypothetical protein
MRFLSDESCDFAVIHALRVNGHDVIAVSEVKDFGSGLGYCDLGHP